MACFDIRQLLRFFDGEDDGARFHSNAINTLLGEELGCALFAHFLAASGYTPEILDDICTQGTLRGARLDRWVAATRGEQAALFQVEVKSWCAHSLGGRPLPVDAAPSTRAEHARSLWERYWDSEARAPRDAPLKKVLLPMKKPPRFATVPVDPVACVWDPLNPHGGSEAWFSCDLEAGRAFNKLWWFSGSLYLRSLLASGQSTVEVPMPLLNARLAWISRIVGSS